MEATDGAAPASGARLTQWLRGCAGEAGAAARGGSVGGWSSRAPSGSGAEQEVGASSPGERDEEPAAKRVGASDRPPPPPPPLPVELQLEIVARSGDAATVLRCAAACKPLRRAILDEAFRDRLALRAAANGGFDPALLVAVSYRLTGKTGDTEGVYPLIGGTESVHVSAWPPSGFRFDTDLLESFEPASSRDSLLVLYRNQEVCSNGGFYVDLLVCNTFTGHVTSVPRMDVLANRIFCPALLTLDSFGRTFELLVMDTRGRTQIFLSKEGKWGDIRQVNRHYDLPGRRAYGLPVIIERTIYWLAWTKFRWILVALQADMAQVTETELPAEDCVSAIVENYRNEGGFILATTAGGREMRLSLVVAEGRVISMWTLALFNFSYFLRQEFCLHVVLNMD
ncbi:hypothetical protein ACP4OV_008079 [Aristida adscensionis]